LDETSTVKTVLITGCSSGIGFCLAHGLRAAGYRVFATARKIEKDILENMGFEVIEAINGEEGLQKLEELYSIYGENLKDKLKLILSDVEMPKMDGYHMAAKIHSDNRFKDVPLIFSSSISDVFSDIRGKAVGAEGYLVKFDSNNFYQQIADILNNKENK
jgi:two-component system chemotaxis response regulator CheV